MGKRKKCIAFEFLRRILSLLERDLRVICCCVHYCNYYCYCYCCHYYDYLLFLYVLDIFAKISTHKEFILNTQKNALSGDHNLMLKKTIEYINREIKLWARIILHNVCKFHRLADSIVAN